MTMDKQQERLGSRKKHAPRDNLDLDVIDALAQGYGVHYGEFKKDHPFTKDANEERLKSKPAGTKPETRIRKLHVKTCPACLKEFTTEKSTKRYCCKKCQENRRKIAWARSRTK